jgi:hypothetical protein
MGGWLDRWAKRSASPAARPDAPAAAGSAPAGEASRSSRREFMTKAAVVTGAAWSVPVIQTALAPAASASPGPGLGSPCSPPGVVCGGGSICSPGNVCGGPGAVSPDCSNGGNTVLCVSGRCNFGQGTCK